MARIAEEEIERLKREVAVERLADARGVTLTPPRRGPHWALPVPRRPHAFAGNQPAKESLALPGGVPRGRQRRSTG